MKNHLLHIRRQIGSKGATLLEAAIGLPVLLIVLMGTIDLGLAIDQYLSITRATYEGLRYGASLSGNHVGCRGPGCAAQNDNTNLQEMETRVKQILKVHGYENARLTFEVTEDTEGGYTYNRLHSTVEMDYHAIMPFFKLIPLKKTIVFTDLYKDKNAP